MEKPTPDPRIAAYVAEVSQPGIPYVSTSHVTLSRLYSEHGEDVVQRLLSAHWLALRRYNNAVREDVLRRIPESNALTSFGGHGV